MDNELERCKPWEVVVTDDCGAVNSPSNVVMLHKEPRVSVLPVLGADYDEFIPIGMNLIAPAVLRQSDNVSLDDVEDDIRGGGSIMWVIYVGDTLVAALTTCVVKHPQRTTLKIEFMGGSRMGEWMDDAIKYLKKIALDAGLAALEADGRKGFGKYVDNSPFREVYTHYVMELN